MMVAGSQPKQGHAHRYALRSALCAPFPSAARDRKSSRPNPNPIRSYSLTQREIPRRLTFALGVRTLLLYTITSLNNPTNFWPPRTPIGL